MRRSVRAVLVAVLAAVSAALPIAAPTASAQVPGPPPATAPRVGLPHNIYAIGDSITTATGTGQLGAEQPFNSWVTGVHPTVIRDGREGSPDVLSMRYRLGIPNDHAFNLASNGRRMQDFDDQAGELPASAEYVVVELGGNDLCQETVAEMTSVAEYRTQFRNGLAAVANHAPNALIYVASIPDIYNLWFIRGFNDDQTGQARKAHFFWDNFTGYHIPCHSLLDNPTSNDPADVQRRQQVRQRDIAYNGVLAQECAAVIRCRYDGNALFDRTSNRASSPSGPLLPRDQWWFEDRDISFNQGDNAGYCPVNYSYSGCGDHFHPSLWGQAKLARLGDERSYQFFDDFTAPTATATPGRSPDVDGLYTAPVPVTFGGTDPSGIRGQEVRIQGPDGVLGPWEPAVGLHPAVTVSDPGTTYLQVRSLDGNGNLSAATTQAITVSDDPCVGPPAPHPFTDVPDRLDDAVSWITDRCNSPAYMDGFADGTFRPGTNLSRAQAVATLWKIEGSPEVTTPHGLTGVPAWVEPAVRWAVANDFMTGFADGSFGPTRPITRAQVVRLLHRLAGEPVVDTPHGLTGVPAWVEPSVRWAVATGVITGFDDGSFRPDRPIVRGQFAAIAFRTYG
jgi:lysophospholipase L1-like esterase